MQPIQIYMAPKGTGPNPWKVALVLAELDLDFKIEWISYLDIKSEPYITLNPNGRLPSMVDPNTNVKLFESGAIIEYLLDRYDENHVISYSTSLQDKWLTHSWLMFQMSGQGPMFGQRMWFVHFHKEKEVHSALDRYAREVKRIVGVINDHLQKRADESRDLNGGSVEPVWLVGDKCTFADLCFVPWNVLLFDSLFPGEPTAFEQEFPFFYQWHRHLLERPAVQRILDMRTRLMKELEDQDTAAAVIERQNKS